VAVINLVVAVQTEWLPRPSFSPRSIHETSTAERTCFSARFIQLPRADRDPPRLTVTAPQAEVDGGVLEQLGFNEQKSMTSNEA